VYGVSGGTGKATLLKNIPSYSGSGSSFFIMFQLISDSSGSSSGIAIKNLNLSSLTLNPNSYSVQQGTSVAAPFVAGTAAMLFGFNPDYTYTDVINAIKSGGRTVSSLSTKTVTGKALDASGALEYVDAPINVTAEAL